MTSKKFYVVATMLLIISAAVFAHAADYSSMSTEELSALRGTLYNATQEERNAFQTEWLSRVEKMTPEERETYLSSGSGNGAGNRNSNGLGNGSGNGRGGNVAGQGKGGGNGGGNGKGRK